MTLDPHPRYCDPCRYRHGSCAAQYRWDKTARRHTCHCSSRRVTWLAALLHLTRLVPLPD